MQQRFKVQQTVHIWICVGVKPKLYLSGKHQDVRCMNNGVDAALNHGSVDYF